MGRATRHTSILPHKCPISIHALRGEGDRTHPRRRPGRAISIHALRGEGDVRRLRAVKPFVISIHALRGEGDLRRHHRAWRGGYFYPRPPWGGRRDNNPPLSPQRGFLSTPSVGRATAGGNENEVRNQISIHALRGEGDSRPRRCWQPGRYFYPRPPWGGRRWRRRCSSSIERFLSTPSVGRATSCRAAVVPAGRISIHALRGEGDPPPTRHGNGCAGFLSTPSVGRATQPSAMRLFSLSFLSTPSVGRATIERFGWPVLSKISIHALRGEGDGATHPRARRTIISIHALRGEGDCKSA